MSVLSYVFSEGVRETWTYCYALGGVVMLQLTHKGSNGRKDFQVKLEKDMQKHETPHWRNLWKTKINANHSL